MESCTDNTAKVELIHLWKTSGIVYIYMHMKEKANFTDGCARKNV